MNQTTYAPPSGPPPNHGQNGYNQGYAPPPGPPPGFGGIGMPGAPVMPTPPGGYQPRSPGYSPPPPPQDYGHNSGYNQAGPGSFPATPSYTPPAGPPPVSGYPGQEWQQQQQRPPYPTPPYSTPPQSLYPPAGDYSSMRGGGFFNGGPHQSSPPRVPSISPSGSSSSLWAPPSGPPPGPPQDYYRSGSSPAPQQQYYPPPNEAPHMPPTQIQTYGSGSGAPQQSFAWSQCTGKKKALCIGINYFKTPGELRGCINDANNMKRFIGEQFGYKPEDIVMLTDDARNPVSQPTRANIIRAMQWLVRDAQPNDSLFFHFSGHGGYTKDLDGDEADGFDEVIYPVDYKKTNHIVDDELHDILVKPLPAGCRLTAIFDSCHSGSALDLPYIYSTEGKVKETNVAAESASSLMGVGKAYMQKDYNGMIKGAMSFARTAAGRRQSADEISRKTKSSPADVISWAGCKDSQTSADVVMGGKGTGAMSYAFMKALRENPRQSYQQLLVNIRGILRQKYSQRPQLSSSHPMDTSVIFIA